MRGIFRFVHGTRDFREEEAMNEREKRIKELAEIIEKRRLEARVTVGSFNEGAGMWYARDLYMKGYRKQSDTVKEFLKLLKEKESPKLLMWEYGEGYLDCIKTAEELAAQYGVEVEE